jgi:CheY-like chemotaxis protein
MTPPIRLLIVDDHPVVRDGLRGMFSGDPEFEVVGEAADGGEAIELATRLDPDVILMDLRMPGVNGTAAIRALAERQITSRVLVLTTYDFRTALLYAAMAVTETRGYGQRATKLDGRISHLVVHRDPAAPGLVIRLDTRDVSALGQLVRSTSPPGVAGNVWKSSRKSSQKRTVLPRIEAGRTKEKFPRSSGQRAETGLTTPFPLPTPMSRPS